MSTKITRNPTNRNLCSFYTLFLHAGDDIDATDSDSDEDNDGDDPEEADDEKTSFDEDRFCRQVLKIQEKAFAKWPYCFIAKGNY